MGGEGILTDGTPLHLACVCVCVHSCFQGHYSSIFLIYPTSFSVQKQGDNPMDAVGCPTKRAAFHG